MQRAKLKTIIAGLTIGALSLSAVTPALAFGGNGAERAQKPRINFEKVDANSDGEITVQELALYRDEQFALRDKNGDGYLSSEELVQSMIERAKKSAAKRVEKIMEKRDSNGDGRISLAELPGQNGSSKLFERLDENRDGVISAQELKKTKKGFGRKKHQAPAE